MCMSRRKHSRKSTHTQPYRQIGKHKNTATNGCVKKFKMDAMVGKLVFLLYIHKDTYIYVYMYVKCVGGASLRFS